MITFGDFVRIFNYIKTGVADNKLDKIWQTLSKSEQQVSINFFQSTIDQIAFASNDYKRLRKYFMDWYAAIRTISKQQHVAIDAFSLPDAHLSEMMKSFGYTVGLDIVPLENKASFFLDLVNFYKKKGTVETIIDILDYYGFTDSDIVEYWLVKNSSGDLVFRPQTVRKSSVASTVLLLNDMQYNSMTGSDPHWMYTEDQVNQLIVDNKINLPSKTPYFSFSSAFRLQELNAVVALTCRVIRDQYTDWLAGGPLPVHVTVYRTGTVASLLEIYLATIYMFEQTYGNWAPTNSDAKYWFYTGELEYTDTIPKLPLNLDEVYSTFKDLLEPRPQTRAEIKTLEEAISTTWTDDQANNILDVTQNMAGPILQSLNSVIYDECQEFIIQGEGATFLNYLLITIGRWMKSNISTKVPNLVVTTLGFSFKQEIVKIINFFKPFRSRFSFFDGVFINEDFLKVEDDGSYMSINTTIVEQPQGGGIACDSSTYPRETYDCNNGTHDIGIVDDEVNCNITLDPVANNQVILGDELKEFNVNQSLFSTVDLLDSHTVQYELVFVDFFSPNSMSCNTLEDPRSLYDCGSLHDISIEDECDQAIRLDPVARSLMNPHISSLGEGIHQGFTLDGGDVVEAHQVGGFYDMDEGWSFDNMHGCDVCQITVTTV